MLELLGWATSGPSVAGTGMSPTFREGLALGMRYVQVPGGTSLALGPSFLGIYGLRPPPANPSCGLGSGGPWSTVMNRIGLREITAQGSPAAYRFSAQLPTRSRKPGTVGRWRRNLTSELLYLSNAPEGTTLETLAQVQVAH